MGVLDKFRHKDEGAIEYKRAQRIAISQTENQNPSGSEEFLEATNRAGFLITDEVVLTMFRDNPSLASLLLVGSPTNSVIKLDRHEADLKRIRIDNHIALLKLTMNPNTYEANGLEMLEGSRMFLHDRVNGAVDGWIGHIATETTRRHVFSEEKGRK